MSLKDIFTNPKTRMLLTAAASVTGNIILPGLGTPAAISGIAGIGLTLANNFLGAYATGTLDAKSPYHDIYEGRHLERAIHRAVCAIIKESTEDSDNRFYQKELNKLLKKLEDFETWHDFLKYPAYDDEQAGQKIPAEISPADFNDLVAAVKETGDIEPLIDKNEWYPFLTYLEEKTEIESHPDVKERVAKRLEKEYAPYVKNAVASDPQLMNLITLDFFPRLYFQNLVTQQQISELPRHLREEIMHLIKTEPEKYRKFYPVYFLPDLKYFVGRVDLFRQMSEKLATDRKVSIHDISGLGKSFASYKYASDTQHRYEKIFFVNAAKEVWLESLAAIAEILDPELKKQDKQEPKAAAFKNWLEENDNWLVIYDNVDLPEQLYPYVPQAKRGDCIFTSNYEVADLAPDVEIKKLEPDEAGQLLFWRANPGEKEVPHFSDEKERAAFEEIIREIDGLPVALVTTGAFVSKKPYFARFLRLMKATPEIVVENEDKFDSYHYRSALKAFVIAFEALTNSEDEKNKDIAEAVKKLLFVSSFIAPDKIPEEFLERYLSEYFEPYREAAAPEDFWDNVVDRLRSYHLLSHDFESKLFNTHRLIQKTLQKLIGSDEERKRMAEEVLTTLYELFPIYDYTNKEACEKYYQHTLTALEYGEKLIKNDVPTMLYYKTARYQELLANYSLAETFYEYALEIARNVYGEEDRETAASLNNLAEVYRLQGKYDKAGELFNLGVVMMEKIVGKEHPDYATCLNNLALAYKEQGRDDEAIPLYEQVLEIDKKTIGNKHPEYARHLSNLAASFYNKGEIKKAKELQQKALGIKVEALENHPDTARSYWWLGFIEMKCGKWDEALPLLEKAYDIFLQFLSENHPDIKNVKSHLSECREALKKK